MFLAYTYTYHYILQVFLNLCLLHLHSSTCRSRSLAVSAHFKLVSCCTKYNLLYHTPCHQFHELFPGLVHVGYIAIQLSNMFSLWSYIKFQGVSFVGPSLLPMGSCMYYESKWQVYAQISADRRLCLFFDFRFLLGVLCIPRARFTFVMKGKCVSPPPCFPMRRCSCFACLLPRRDVTRLGSAVLCPPATLFLSLPKTGKLRRVVV